MGQVQYPMRPRGCPSLNSECSERLSADCSHQPVRKQRENGDFVITGGKANEAVAPPRLGTLLSNRLQKFDGVPCLKTGDLGHHFHARPFGRDSKSLGLFWRLCRWSLIFAGGRHDAFEPKIGHHVSIVLIGVCRVE